MAALSDYAANKLLDHLLGVASFTMPTTVYLAAFTTDPGDDGSGTEVSASGTAYAREEVDFDAATGRLSKIQGPVEFSVATASWGTVSHLAIFDAATGGNLLAKGALTASKAIGSGDQLRIPDEDLTVSFPGSA